jgi:hypothetical protein
MEMATLRSLKRKGRNAEWDFALRTAAPWPFAHLMRTQPLQEL